VTATPESQAAAPVDLRVVHAVPFELGDTGLAIQAPNGSRTCVAFNSIEAISAVEVGEAEGDAVLVVDLLLNWVHRDGKPLRAVRMRSDRIESARSEAGEPAPACLTTLLPDLMQRAQAIPLPDPESALAIRFHRFATIETYEATVLRRN